MDNDVRAYQLAHRARNHLWATFFFMGLIAMAWVPRIPEIKESLGLSDGAFGLVLLGSTVGSIPGAQIAGRAVHAIATRKFMRICGFIMPLGLFVMGSADTVIELVLGLFILGASFSAIDVAANVQAVAIEGHLKARYMSSFHGMWSIGAFIAALGGGAVAHLVTPRQNLQGLALFSFIALVVALNGLLDAERDGHRGEKHEETAAKVPLFARAVLPLYGIGIGLVCSLIPESGIYDWSGILLKEHMGIAKGVTATAATVFSFGMIISRILGDRAFNRWGHKATVKYGGYIGGSVWSLSLIIGIPLSDSHRTLALVIVAFGFLVAGLCMGPFFPAFNLAAMSQPGIAPSVGMARVAVISISAYFAGPTLIGGLSELTSLPIAFAFPAILFISAGYLSRFIVVKEIK